jgi:uncharacterized surface protein with fasciclin (FAS1) repeats
MSISFKLCLAFILAASLSAAPAFGQLGARRAAKRQTAVTANKEVIPGAKMDIVDTAMRSGSFKTLTAAITAAGLDQTLKGKGPFTVFAPTDEAFAKLPTGTMEMLLKPENKQKLAAILTYHVMPGNVKAVDVTKLHSAKTVNGEMLTIKAEGDDVMVNNANVTTTDIVCTNGTIHVIDTVLMPRE